MSVNLTDFIAMLATVSRIYYRQVLRRLNRSKGDRVPTIKCSLIRHC